MKYTYKSLVLAIGTSLFLASNAFAAPADFDQDGKSDLVTVTIQSNGSLDWGTLNPSSGSYSSRGLFGSVGNNLTLTTWVDSTTPIIGVVALDSSNAIEWKIKDQTGALQSRSFGAKGNLAISGGDFNGNGTGDAVVAKKSQGKVLWRITYDMFTASSKAKSIRFGSSVDKIFYARPVAGKDWLGTVGVNSKQKTALQFKDLKSGKLINSGAMPSFIKKSGTSRPFPVRQTTGTDLIGFSRTLGSETKIDVFKPNGKRVSSVSLPLTGDVVVGDYTDGPGEEIVVKGADGTDFYVFNPVTKDAVAMAGRKGIAVDSININAMTAAAPPAIPPSSPTPPSYTPPSGNPNFPGRGTTIACTQIIDISTLPDLLYKNENVHGGRGRSWLDQGHRLGKVRTVLVAGTDGYVSGCFGLYRCDSPYGCRYYQQMCGDSLSNAQFSAAANAHGDGSGLALATNGSGVCYSFRAGDARYGNIRK